jgi:glutaredoxin
MKIILTAVLLFASYAQAGTVYKSAGADGKIVYSDEPPSNMRESKTLKIEDAPATPLPPAVLRYQAELRKSMQGRLADATKVDSVGKTVLFGASWCGYCKKAKAYLNAKGVKYSEYDIDSAEGAKAYALAGGSGGVPLLLADGRSLRGFSEASYDAIFAAKRR